MSKAKPIDAITQISHWVRVRPGEEEEDMRRAERALFLRTRSISGNAILAAHPRRANRDPRAIK